MSDIIEDIEYSEISTEIQTGENSDTGMIPIASADTAGIASFNNKDFMVTPEGKASLSTPTRELIDKIPSLEQEVNDALSEAITEITELKNQAEQSASSANSSAISAGNSSASALRSEQNAAISEQNASEYASNAEQYKNDAEQYSVSASESAVNAANSETQAQNYSSQAASSAANASESASNASLSEANSANYALDSQNYANNAANSASEAMQSEQNAGNSATLASQDASNAANSAAEAFDNAARAEQYMLQAKEYADKEYELVNSYDELPRPGNSAFIYLVPGGTETGDRYKEYLWISQINDYELIGTIGNIDLSQYAMINGTYPLMSVGKDSDGNIITQTYAKKSELLTETSERQSADTALQSSITNIVNGTTIVGKATADGNGNNIANTYVPRTFLENLYFNRTGTLTATLVTDKPTANTANYMQLTANNTTIDFTSTNKFTITRTLVNNISISKTDVLKLSLSFAMSAARDIEFGARVFVDSTQISSNQAFGVVPYQGSAAYTSVNEDTLSVVLDNIVGVQTFNAGQVLKIEIFTRQAGGAAVTMRLFCGVNVSGVDRNSFAGIAFNSTSINTAQIADGAVTLQKLSSDVQTSLGKADTALQDIPIASSTVLGGVQPVDKTTAMTQEVGVDSSGKLYTTAGAGVQMSPQTVSIAVADWSGNTATVTVNNVDANSVIFFAPTAETAAVKFGVSITAQGTNSITFNCITVPDSVITGNLVIFNGG